MKRNIIIVVVCLLTILFFQFSIQESFAATKKNQTQKTSPNKLTKEGENKKQAKEKETNEAYARQIVNQSYTFLNIGENDTLKSVLSKMSDEYELSRQTEEKLHYPMALHTGLEGIGSVGKLERNTKNYYKYFRLLADNEGIINKYGKSMIGLVYHPKKPDSIIHSVIFYFSKSSEKLLTFEALLEDGPIDEIAKKFSDKFGEEVIILESEGGRRSNSPLDTSMRASGNGLYYWEKGNDCMWLGSATILFSPKWGGGRRFLDIIYGSNYEEYIAPIKQMHEQNIRKEVDRKSKELNKIF